MSIIIDENTGWSALLYYDPADGEIYEDDAYSDTGNGAQYASWFMRSWWEQDYKWARKYKNLTEMKQRITDMSFLACSGHSNGLTFSGTPSPGELGPVYGYGCTFTVDLCVVNPGTDPVTKTAATSHTLPSIDKYNCYYSGYGKTNTQYNNTGFGDVKRFGPGTGYEYDSKGNKRYRHTQEFKFEDAPIIEPGGEMYVTVRVTNWASGSTTSNTLLVIQSKAADFTAVMEEEPSNYIWKFNGTEWEKVAIAHICTDEGWTEVR